MNYLNNPIDILSDSIADSMYQRFPQISYLNRNWENWSKLSREQQIVSEKENPENQPHLWVTKERLIRKDEIMVIAFFPQTWGSTALGFGGVGGAAMTTAYTIVLQYQNIFNIYFNGKFAYSVNSPNQTFFEDLHNQTIASRSQYDEKYLD